MDVVSCLVLNTPLVAPSSPDAGSSSSAASVASALLLGSLGLTFDRYSDSVAYAIEACSAATQSTLQTLAGALGKGSSSDEQESPAEQDEEPLAHLMELLTVCEQAPRSELEDQASIDGPTGEWCYGF